MASADFWTPIPIPLSIGSQWQVFRSCRLMRVTFPLMPAVYTSTVSVQVSGFDDICLLTHCDRLKYDFCSSGQCFACGFLQTPPRDGRPCRRANRSPCRANSGHSPPGHPTATTRIGTAPVNGANKKTPPTGGVFKVVIWPCSVRPFAPTEAEAKQADSQ